jgi:uncharacterized protein YjbJ (UPF0337 family)
VGVRDAHHRVRARANHANVGLISDYMNKQELKGRGKQIEGSIREEIGKLTHNPSEKLKGKIQQVQGKASEKVGKLKSRSRN